MNSPKLCIKWFAIAGSDFAPEQLVPIFHQWIQQKLVSDHVLIDVADYSHVRNGPGIVLVSHEANFAFDRAEGRPGLLYTRLRGLSGTFLENLRAVTRASVTAAARLEEQTGGRLRFQTDQLLFGINDRLHAPPGDATFQAVQNDLKKFLSPLLGGTVTLEPRSDERRCFEVLVRSSAAPSIADLSLRLR